MEELPQINWENVVSYRRAYFCPALDNMRRLGEAVGDIASFVVMEQPAVLVTTPALVREALITQAASFTVQKPLSSPPPHVSMLNSDGEAHHQRRRQIAPAFRPRHFAAYAAMIAQCAARLQSEWKDGSVIHIAREMERLALNIIGKTVLDRDGFGERDPVGDAQRMMTRLSETRWSPAHLPLPWRVPRRAGVSQAITSLNQTAQDLLRERRLSGRRGDDMVSVLLEDQSEDQSEGNAEADKELVVQIIGLLGAGTVNVAKSLAWMFYQLAQRPDEDARVHQEASSACCGTDRLFDRLSDLPYSLQVYHESLRTMPRTGSIQRWSVEDVELGGCPIPKGTLVFIFPYLLHTNSRYFPEPGRFEPGRFAPGWQQTQPRHAFIPFGEGAHVCIGNYFTLMEAQIILAVLSQKVRFEIAPGQRLRTDVLSKLNSRYDVRLRVRRRPGKN